MFVSFFFSFRKADGQISAGASAARDTTRRPVLRLQDVSGIPWENRSQNPLFLRNPSNISSEVIYNPEKDEYIIYQKVGSFDYRTPVYMSPE
ncbi:MAG: hypothetical protein GX876_12515, partial [Bacteroidales bacterium]|nr:hypothetical protein [Bacteroidales bacterium]